MKPSRRRIPPGLVALAAKLAPEIPEVSPGTKAATNTPTKRARPKGSKNKRIV